jgi:hypothetical protein
MDKLHKTSVTVMGLVALALFAAFATGYISRPAPGAAAQPAAQPVTQPATQSASGDQQGSNADGVKYSNALVADFASRLGVDQAKLNSAFTAAANDTVDQAVKDGKLTQDQATKIKALTQNGLAAVIMTLPSVAGDETSANNGDSGLAALKISGAMDSISNAAATAIGITSQQLDTEQQTGKSIADVAQAHNVSPQKVKDAMLAAARADINSQVQSGKMTQAQGDAQFSEITRWLDSFMNTAPKIQQ